MGEDMDEDLEDLKQLEHLEEEDAPGTSQEQEKSVVVERESPKRTFTEADFGCTDKERFQLELEFVQCLSSPQYIHWLAQNQWFENAAFLNYLKYLQYWKRPEYAKFIIYPHTFYFLDMIQNKDFQKAMARDNIKEMVHAQQFFFWQHYRENRLRDSMATKEGEVSSPVQVKTEGESEEGA